MRARTRLSAEERRDQLIAAAEKLVIEQGHLPLSLETLAEKVGISKALIYAYFSTQPDILNAILERRLAETTVLPPAAREGRKALRAQALAMAQPYFEQVCEIGPVIHYILRDAFMARSVSPAAARMRDRAAGRLARLAVRELSLSPREAVAAFNMLLTIPTEAGELVFKGDLDRATANDFVRELLTASIDALTPRKR